MLKKSMRFRGKAVYSPIGVDIGDRSVKMAQLKKTADGVHLHALAIREIRGLETGEGPGLTEILNELQREGPFVHRQVISRMPHSQVNIIPVKMEGKGVIDEAAVLKEAEHYLTYPVEQAVLDYIPVFEGPSEVQKVLLVATRRSDVDFHLRILKNAGLQPRAIDVGPNALLRTYRFIAGPKESRVLLINVGGNQTFFTILRENHIQIDRQIHWGEDLLVDRLSRSLNLEKEKARRMLYTYGIWPQAQTGLFPDEETEVFSEETISGTIHEVVAGDLEDLAREVEKILIYYASENRGATIDETYLMGGSVYLLGSGPFLKNFHLFLEKRLGIRVLTLDPFKAFQADLGTPYNPTLFGVSIGLALRGLECNGA